VKRRQREVFQGKRVFITGAASGIGRATALAAASCGATVFLTDISDAALQETVDAIFARGGHVGAARAFDIADYDAVRAFADTLHAEHGSMDVVMNIAGIAIWGAVEQLEHAQWRKVIEINLMGPIHVIECFVPAMIAAGHGGHLVNVSSAAGLFGLPWHAAYSASKFGLRGVSEVLRFDLARHGIHVSLVCPGAVNTGLVETVRIAGIDTQSRGVSRVREHFRKHATTPEDAAEAILRGVASRRYMVFTSADIRVGHWVQRKFELPYTLAMKLMNDQFHRLKSRGAQG